MSGNPPNIQDIQYLLDQFQNITDERKYELPSDYIERVRYIPKELTKLPGKFSFLKTPYLREILDQLGPISSAEKVVFLKSAQIGATTGILENFIAYNIGSNPSPQLYISADRELIQTGMETKVERLLDSCNLREKIFSQTNKKRATGDTTFKKEYPGGFLHAIGARNPGKLRSMSYPIILFDEIDGFPDELGKEGDPVSLAENRTNAYGNSRKILYLSTPLITQTSKIYALYLQGDQRHYYVPCKYCGEMQVLKWHAVNEAGKVYGITFEVENGLPLYDTVGYKCPYCDKIMKNHDKSLILNKGEWRATEKAKEPGLVSYWANTLISPPGMYSWEKMVADWTKCWDLEMDRPKDKEQLRTFYNTKRGLPFTEEGDSVKYEKAILHKRTGFLRGKIPNKLCHNDNNSHILLLTCAVDVHKNNLTVDVKGWTEGGRSYTIDYFVYEGETEEYNSVTWQKLYKLLTEKIWTDGQGKEYMICNAFIDSGKYTEYVYEFCRDFSKRGQSVFAIKGTDYLKKGETGKSFKRMTQATLDDAGLKEAVLIGTVKLKDKIVRMMNRLQWDFGKLQPEWYPNFPENFGDEYFKMFEKERRVEVRNKITNQFMRIEYRVTPGADNHAFDTFVYNMSCLEALAEYACKFELGLEALDWEKFWEYAKTGVYYS